MTIETCRSYAARPAGTDLYRRGRTAYKLYYVDIYGRPNPERFAWDLNELDRSAIPTALNEIGVAGVGFVVAFPHVAKLFRFWEKAETLLVVQAFVPKDAAPMDLNRGGGAVEFACLAEAVIAGQEYELWAAAESVEAYLEQWAEWTDLPIVDHGKLKRYW
jgi:hypothetical protein